MVRRSVLLVIAIVVVVVHCISVQPWMLDDAFISFRYAENLAAGNGPVYNTGERVEGYTCFLWVVLLAAGHSVGLDTPLWSQILGGTFALGCLLLLFFAYRFSDRFSPDQSATAALFLGTCGVFTPWAVSGMEVTLFTFLLLLSLLLESATGHRSWRDAALGLSLALLAMTRPEGLLVAGLIGTDRLTRCVRERSLTALIPAGVFVAIYFPYFLWRWSYYGFLLPNTFYAKVGSTMQQMLRGLRYTTEFFLIVLPQLLWAVLWLREGWRNGYRLILIVLVSYTLYVIAVGGDIMPAFRFFTPVLTLLCLVAAVAILSRPRRAAILICTLVVAFNILQLLYNSRIDSYIRSDTVAAEGREVGMWLREHAPADAWIATNTGGSIPYYSRLRSVDMLGLNDAHIAHRQIAWIGTGPAGHEKGDGAYVLSRRPDYIQFGSSLGDRVPRFLSDQELWRLPQFHQLYEMRSFRMPSGKRLILFVKRGENAP